MIKGSAQVSGRISRCLEWSDYLAHQCSGGQLLCAEKSEPPLIGLPISVSPLCQRHQNQSVHWVFRLMSPVFQLLNLISSDFFSLPPQASRISHPHSQCRRLSPYLFCAILSVPDLSFSFTGNLKKQGNAKPLFRLVWGPCTRPFRNLEVDSFI